MTRTTSAKAQVIDRETRQAAAWFARLRADDVTSAERAAFAQWLNEDARHRPAYEGFERFWSRSGEYAGDKRVAQEVRKLQRSWHPLRWAAAATVLIAAGAWLMLTNTVYQTGIGEQRTVALPDGSRITLNTGSRIRVRFSEDHRSVELLRGQAYFNVAKDAVRPFAVKTNEGSVQVLGTEFDVYRQTDRVRVTLVDGEVRVDTPNGRQGPVLSPGQRLSVANGRPGQIEKVSLSQSQAWLSGKLVFDNEPLESAVAEANRYSKKKIAFGDASLKMLRISGVFRAGEPEEFIHAITSYFPAMSQRNGDRGYVLLARRGGP